MESKALIFIPDISGFTEFVTQTESKHSSHIISELLEEVIKVNTIGLEISEIEGDAILFYKKGDPPKLEELLDQAEKMFNAFHYYIKIIERDNVCRCGACLNSSKLTLKFVCHYGTLDEVRVQNFTKIMGSDVILSHRLLKNSIKSKEYILFTDKYMLTQDKPKSLGEWVEIKDHVETFDNFGQLFTKYVNLSSLLEKVPNPPNDKSYSSEGAKFNYSIDIDAPLLTVHGELISNDSKYHWVEGIKEIKEDSPINRINASHTCVFDDLEVHFVTKANVIEKNEIVYSEEADAGFGFSILNDFKLEEVDNKTRLSFRLIYGNDDPKTGFLGKIVNKIKYWVISKKLLSTNKQGLESFKKYCESLVIKEAV